MRLLSGSLFGEIYMSLKRVLSETLFNCLLDQEIYKEIINYLVKFKILLKEKISLVYIRYIILRFLTPNTFCVRRRSDEM